MQKTLFGAVVLAVACLASSGLVSTHPRHPAPSNQAVILITETHADRRPGTWSGASPTVMRPRTVFPWAAVSLAILAALAGYVYAQEQLKQTAYVKASNTHAADHFGCGGVLDGHTGNAVALSADG